MSEILVSACLLGRPCRYDGASKKSSAVEHYLARMEARGARVVPVCPEELGDLGTPRPAAELRGGDGQSVLSGAAAVTRLEDGQDLSEAFVRGARRAVSMAPGATRAILKARSPSCGCRQTHIDGRLQPGMGVFAALLSSRGLELCSDEDL
jgi:uncharacterized protein YbbK (DUF523 family)